MDDHRLSIVSSVEVLREEIALLRGQNKSIAFVPTMGALHEGHLSLIDFARSKADQVVSSIFVNPKQFGAGEDLDAYPRPLVEDIRALEGRKTDIVFTPAQKEVYPDNFATEIHVSELTDMLCGESRPGHFDGMATVVVKLLLMVMPDFAVFGEKDYQQLMVIRRFVSDLNIPVEILGAPIVRDKDGLALSSRNAYLTDSERELAPLIYQTLQELSTGIKSGDKISQIMPQAREKLTNSGFDVDYLEVRSAKTLALISDKIGAEPARIFVAARLGSTRLIDNIAI